MRIILNLLFAFLFLVKSIFALEIPEYLQHDIKLSTDKIKAGEVTKLAIILKIKEGWHINSHKPTFDYLVGTLFELQFKEGFILTDIQYPKGKTVSLSFAEEPLDVYEGTIIIFASIKISDKLLPGDYTLKGNLTYQACNNQVCVAPTSVEIIIPIKIANENDTITTINQNIFSNYHKTSESYTGNKSDLTLMLEEKGILLTLIAIFLIGLALNLTPCVYPMLSVTVSLFGTQKESDVFPAFIKAVIYVLGMATMYSILGVTAALSGELFGSWLQSPLILAGISVLLFALALSSFGLYQIQVPYWLTSKLGNISGSNLIGIYLSGLVVGIFAAPCVGPPVIALMTLVASKGSIIFGFWTFFVLALGLGFPYLILGTFSGLLKKIPRSGSWLVWVEHIFGVILIGASIFYLLLALIPNYAIYAVPLTLIAGGIYLGFIDPSAKKDASIKYIRLIFGLIAISLGLIFLNNLQVEGITWEKYSDTILQEAKENNMPVLLDFYADWCIPCIELDRKTWTNKEVIKATEKFRKVKVDLTHYDSPTSEALRKKYNIAGVPTIIFIRSDGTEATASRIVGFISAEDFLLKLEQAFR